jgi:hypothetical protein
MRATRPGPARSGRPCSAAPGRPRRTARGCSRAHAATRDLGQPGPGCQDRQAPGAPGHLRPGPGRPEGARRDHRRAAARHARPDGDGRPRGKRVLRVQRVTAVTSLGGGTRAPAGPRAAATDSGRPVVAPAGAAAPPNLEILGTGLVVVQPSPGLCIRTLAWLTRPRGEPNGEPTTADTRLRQATCSHCGCGQAARRATYGTTERHFESAS